MKKITIPCDFAGKKIPFPIYVGQPETELHPLTYQSFWLSRERGGLIPDEVMNSFAKLHMIAKGHNITFEDICLEALTSVDKKEDD